MIQSLTAIESAEPALRRILWEERTVSLADLSRRTGASEQEVTERIAGWIECGEVELLRPVFASENVCAGVYCRVRAGEDRDYVWEQSFFEGRRRTADAGCVQRQTNTTTRGMTMSNERMGRKLMRMLNLLTPAVLLAGTSFAMDLPEVNPLEVKGDIITAGSSTVYPLTEAVAERFRDEGYSGNITIDSIGTGAGFERFCKAGETDIANASRAIKDKEVESARAIGREPLEFRVGTDALAVVLSKANTFVTNLTKAQLAAAFSTATLWSDLDPSWPAEKILRFSPGTDSGTFDYFVEDIFAKKKEPILNAANLQLSEDDNVLVQGVSGSPYAIGYFGYAYYVENRDKVRSIGIEGVAPSHETVDNGTYPLARPLFIYSDANVMKQKPQVAAFINFYLTYVNELVDDVGYFPAPAAQLDAAHQNFLNATR